MSGIPKLDILVKSLPDVLKQSDKGKQVIEDKSKQADNKDNKDNSVKQA